MVAIIANISKLLHNGNIDVRREVDRCVVYNFYMLPFQFNQFESTEDCRCVNREFILFVQDKNPSICTFYIL